MKFSLVFKCLTPESKPVVPLDWFLWSLKTRVLSFSLCNDFLAIYSSNESFWSYHMKNKWELVPEQVTQAIDKSWLNENTFLTVCSVQCLPRTQTSLSRHGPLRFNTSRSPLPCEKRSAWGGGWFSALLTFPALLIYVLVMFLVKRRLKAA